MAAAGRKEWSIGENIEHGRVLLRSFRRLLKIIWPVFSPYAKLKRRRPYEVSIDDVYERPDFPLNVGWIWPSKYNGEFLIVPKGVEHMPVAEEEVQVILIEPVSTLNTGNVISERTVERPDKI